MLKMSLITFGDHPLSESLTFNQAQEPLSMNISRPPRSLTTIVIYDMTAPNAEYPTKSPFVHFLEINIPENRMDLGNVILPYIKPSPPPNTGKHVYVIDIFDQSDPITEFSIPRERFPVLEFVNQYGLKHIERQIFQTEKRISGFDGANSDSGDDKYCRCVVDVAARQPEACNLEKAWFERREGRKCANPYAVCHKSIQGESGRPDCGEYIRLNEMSDQQHKIGLGTRF